MKNLHRFTLTASIFMPRKRILVAALLTALVGSNASMAPRGGAAVVSASSGTYDAVGAFSITSNPNGSWSYGWEANLGGSFTQYAVENSAIYQGADFWEGPDNCGGEFLMPLVGFNHTGATLNYASGVSQPANVLNLHPSCSGKLSVLRWTAPTTGSFNVQGLFQGIDTRSTTTDVHIRQNSSDALLDANINGYGSQTPFSFTRNMTAGETLDFIVGFGANGNYNYDSTGLSVTISPPNTHNIPDGDVPGLIAAINSANASGEPSTINLAHNGRYVLTNAAETADIAAGLPFITGTGHLTINGNGATIQRSSVAGTPDFWLLQVSAGTVTLDGVTLTGGSQGGLRMSSSTVIVQNSAIMQNTGGGGINNICGSLTLLNSTVSNNKSDSAWGGGGVFLWGFSCAPGMPTANISFSTIFENSNVGWGRGNAIGTAYVASPGGVFLKNSILASPSHPSEAVCNNGSGTLYSLGHNILGDATDVFGSRCYEALTAPGDIINTNPLLGPLANNGGLTPTHQTLECSPAIDAVPIADSTDTNGVPITTDQRGISRPQGAASDIGAVEAVRTTTVTVPGNAGPWLQGQNPTFDYGVHDNVPPVVIDASSGIPFIEGSNITLTYVSGMFTGDGGRGYSDANGSTYPTNTYEGGNGRFPGFYMNPGPTVYGGELVGAFAHNGVIVGPPFPIGNGPTILTIPAGATELMMGINDNYYSDNSGTLLMRVTIGQTVTPPTLSCPPPFSASADNNCQARVPNVLAGVTASGGCGGPVTLSQSPAAGTLVGLGTTTITVTATDAAHDSSTCTTTFTVTDNTPPTITAPADISVVDNAAASCGGSVNPGTPTTSDNCGVASVVGIRSDGKALTALYPVGATVITWTVTDNSGNRASAQQNVVVTNPAPQVTITGPSSGALYAVNTAVNFTGSFSDNAGDSHTAVWTFDGTPQAGIANEATRTVSASHTFTTAGVYLVTLSITDDCSQTVASNQVGGFDALVVVYDPNAGFVTGGGWINSPAGAYAPNPNLVGQANFGFVSKYQKGANVPDGQTEFQFKVANLNFHSTVYEWLVVAGAKAQYKGSGTINGMGNYGFILTAVDGDISGGGGIDKFRIKIWDKNNGDAIVYDNQIGAGIDENPTTALAGGSIVIHK